MALSLGGLRECRSGGVLEAVLLGISIRRLRIASIAGAGYDVSEVLCDGTPQ